MRVLIIGGTRFVGRAIAESVLARGHELVLFNRGRTNPDLFPDVARVHGDRRRGGLEQLAGETFDAIFDTGAYLPADVTATARLAERAAHLCLISTISVYRDPVARHADERAPTWPPPETIDREASTPEQYGALKALCERTALAMNRHTLIVRPGLIVGPHDYTDRMTSWLRRLSSSDVVLAGEPDQPVQLIEVRDLAQWVVLAAERRLSGIFNAVGPREPLTFDALLAAASTVLGRSARVVWAGDAFLASRGIELPLWIPRSDHPFFELSNASAVAAGLRLRPVQDTLADVAAWQADAPPRAHAEWSPAEEARLISEAVRPCPRCEAPPRAEAR